LTGGVRGLGLTRAQWILLSHLARQPGASQSDLAESLQQEKNHHQPPGGPPREERLDPACRPHRRPPGVLPAAHAKAEQMMTRLIVVADQLRVDAMAGLAPARREALIDDLLCVKANLLRMDSAS